MKKVIYIIIMLLLAAGGIGILWQPKWKSTVGLIGEKLAEMKSIIIYSR